MTGVVLQPEQRWVCPNCDLTDVTHWPADRVASRFHNCRGLRGMEAPMVPAGTSCKVEAITRDDYVGHEMVQTDMEGRPISFVVTTRDDGNDVVVRAPCAQLTTT